MTRKIMLFTTVLPLLTLAACAGAEVTGPSDAGPRTEGISTSPGKQGISTSPGKQGISTSPGKQGISTSPGAPGH